MLCTDEAAKGFQVGDHGSTFGGNPLACAAGIAVMEYFGEANVLDNVNLVSAALFEKLNKLKSKYSCITKVRGMGLLIGIEFDETVIASGLKEELFRNGFLVSSIGKSVIRIAPPLVITKSQALSFVRTLDQLLSTRMGGKPNPILNAFKNIGRKETPAMKALAEQKPAEESKPAALPEPEDELE
jgi:acetylornithine/succinyldiaminopimelate/putrescine aminotransferase